MRLFSNQHCIKLNQLWTACWMHLLLFCFSPWVFTNDPNPHDSWGQGGVIQPSAPHWHQWAVFILEQSVCLFIKGVDQNTPQLAGFNPPPLPPILSSPSLLYIEANLFFPSSCIVPARPSCPPSLELWATAQDSYFDRKKRFNLYQSAAIDTFNVTLKHTVLACTVLE